MKSQDQTTPIPRHLGIIMDGNRRWAREKGLPLLEGHRQGAEVLKKIAIAAKGKGIKILTFFCFSTENWQRPKNEVDYLMDLVHEYFLSGIEKLKNENIKIKVIGQKDKLPKKIIADIARTEKETENYSGMTLNLALSYGGRAEIVDAVKNIIKSGIDPEKITEETIKENLWTSDVDLVIRTGGEQRLSGFLLWQAAYSEFLFVNKFWPDFSEADLDAALADYANRQRRFGK
jgi:undecaprenyl diphosphate synthase